MKYIAAGFDSERQQWFGLMVDEKRITHMTSDGFETQDEALIFMSEEMEWRFINDEPKELPTT